MLFVEICIGSSCHLKGSHDIVELMKSAIDENGIGDEVVLMGSFCLGKCNRDGVSVKVGDEIHVGITRENFKEFFKDKILKVVKE